MTSFEHLTLTDLLSFYLLQNYPQDRELFIVYNEYPEQVDEYLEAITPFFNDLDAYGLTMSPMFRIPGLVIIQGTAISEKIARLLIDKYSKAPFMLEIWKNGECIHENQ